jgi:hypothetical protein
VKTNFWAEGGLMPGQVIQEIMNYEKSRKAAEAEKLRIQEAVALIVPDDYDALAIS